MRCNISGTVHRRHLTGRSRHHSRSVADRFCDHGPKSVVEILRSTLPGAIVRFTQQRARECRTANYKYEPINGGAAAEIHSLAQGHSGYGREAWSKGD